MRKMVPIITFVLLAFSHVSVAGADEISELRELIRAQNQQLQQLRQRLDELEAEQKQQSQQMETKISEAVKDKQVGALPDSLQWAEKVRISGDLRYRHEHIDAEKVGSVRWKEGRDRDRIRARLMIEAIVNDEWGLGFRLASGQRDILVDSSLDADMFPDPISGNQTLKQNFSSKDIWIDLAYFDWHPKAVPGLNVYGGKVKNPFYTVGKNELVWDHDLNPEGIASKYQWPIGKNDTIHINGGGFWVDESSGGVDTSLWGVQGYLRHTIGNPDYILGGVSYWDYGNIKGKVDNFGILAGNTADPTGTMWAGDYDLLEVFSEYGTKFWGLPVAVFGSWVRNFVAVGDQDTGWLVGAKLNKAKDPGSWEFGYNYRDLEADAVVGAFTDSDFIGGGTNGRGHEFGLTYQVAKNVQAGLTYFHNENDRANSSRDLDYRRLHTDLKFKF